MKKKFLLLIAISLIFAQASSCVIAKSAMSAPVRLAVKKYKAGNYTGCLQSCMNIVVHDPTNTIAYYYMAMSYVQAGKKDEAIKAYAKVLKLSPNARLAEYATTGKRCLETPDKCHLESGPASTTPELDKFIATPSSDGLSPAVRSDLRKKRLNEVKNEINSGKDMDEYKIKRLLNFVPKFGSSSKVAQRKPSNAEIVAALKVLREAGLTPYSQSGVQVVAQSSSEQESQYQQVKYPEAPVSDAQQVVPTPDASMSNYQSPDLAQVNMLMGGNNKPTDNNTLMNMVPYMLAQDKNGTNHYSPQLMQAVIMNSMMPNFNFNVDDDKDK